MAAVVLPATPKEPESKQLFIKILYERLLHAAHCYAATTGGNPGNHVQQRRDLHAWRANAGRRGAAGKGLSTVECNMERF